MSEDELFDVGEEGECLGVVREEEGGGGGEGGGEGVDGGGHDLDGWMIDCLIG